MSRYEAAGFFLLRTPALATETFRHLMDEPERTAERLVELAKDTEVRRALLVASPDLVAALDRLESTEGKKAERIRSRLLRYLIRMTTRPTPFGAFSGVAIGRFGPSTTAHLGSPAIARTRARADMGWLLALIKKIEENAELLPSLQVVVNATLHRVGDRMVLPYADVYGEADNRAVRIRATPAVDLVVRAAATPVPYGRLVEELAAAFPDVRAEVVTGLVRELWQLNVLTSDLRPPLTEPQPETYLLKRLIDIPAAAELAGPLEEVVDLARQAHDEAGLLELGSAQRGLLPDHDRHTYQLDAAADLREPYVNQEVGVAVADAVDCLMRLSQAMSSHYRHLNAYREAFVERYGLDARVPMLELLGPDQGLEAPASYTEPRRTYELPGDPPPDTSAYDRAVAELAAHAWWDGAAEVELTNEWLARLAPQTRAKPLLPSVDVYAQIQAESSEAIDSGDWRVVLTPNGLAEGGRTYGRFFDLLGDEAVGLLRAYAQREEELFPEVVYAELAYLPTRGRYANVAVRPRLRPYEVPVNTTPAVGPDEVIGLGDILVGAAEDRLYLWSRRLDREVVVTQHHMLTPAAAPNVSRFLLEVSQDGYVIPSGFRWGSLESAPFLPRVVRGKVVLRPAQWRVKELAPGWRERWRVPRHVYLAEDDNRLLLDLDHPLAVAELGKEVKSKGTAVLHEALPGLEGLWLKDELGRHHAEEIVVPTIVTSRELSARGPARRQPSVPPVRVLPGGAWSFLKLYAAYDRHDEIIAGPLRELVSDLRAYGMADRWFYMRYADPRPHLRLRFRGDAAALLPAITAWAGTLVERGIAGDLSIATYEPEIARYGGTRTFDAIERFFEANSDVTAELIAAGLELRPEHLAVAAVDTLCAQWGVPVADRLALVPRHDDDDGLRKSFREHRAYLCELLVPQERRPHPEGRADHDRLAPVFAAQASAVRAAAQAVRRAEGDLAGSEPRILGSLMHMQINRLMPIDLDRESRCYALWHHVLRAVRGRLAAERTT